MQWAVICVLMAGLWEAQPPARRGTELERAIVGRRASEAELDLMTMLAPPTIPRPRLAPHLPGAAASAAAAAAAAAALPPVLATPSAPDLLVAVAQFLRADVGKALQQLEGGAGKRVAYLARVAANGVELVAREHAALERQLLDLQAATAATTMSPAGGGGAQRWGEEAEEGAGAAAGEGTAAWRLLVLAARQVAIDQPTYATLVGLVREEAEAAEEAAEEAEAEPAADTGAGRAAAAPRAKQQKEEQSRL